MNRSSITAALGAALLAGCLSVPEPSGVVEDDGGVVSDCALVIDFEESTDLDGWEKIEPAPEDCTCGIEAGELFFHNNGVICDCFFQDAATIYDLRDLTVGLQTASRGEAGLTSALSIVFPDDRTLFFGVAAGTVYFGDCPTPGACNAAEFGTTEEGPDNVFWRFRLEADDVLFEVSPDGESWSNGATAANVDRSQASVWIQLGSFQTDVLPADDVSVDNLRVCAP